MTRASIAAALELLRRSLSQGAVEVTNKSTGQVIRLDVNVVTEMVRKQQQDFGGATSPRPNGSNPVDVKKVYSWLISGEPITLETHNGSISRLGRGADFVVATRTHKVVRKILLARHRSMAPSLPRPPQPPHSAEFLLRISLPLKTQDEWIGDLNEKFERMAAQFGKRRALFFYWWKAIFLLRYGVQWRTIIVLMTIYGWFRRG
jgi:hypothetical protein